MNCRPKTQQRKKRFQSLEFAPPFRTERHVFVATARTRQAAEERAYGAMKAKSPMARAAI